ncbi:MAG: TonB-dependent receptor [Pseudomonadota bacterium]|jgi:Outer membrane receptor proteins, mostly Fe transport|nr:MAG: TonB-dependent receptor [Pseudomonadota bacterium]
MRSRVVFAAVAATAAVLSAESRADEPLEEVVVTASLREQPLASLPASVSVIERETIELAGVQHFQDVLGLVPNLNWSAGSSRPRYFQLRGIGELEQFQGAPNHSVGFLIDGIDFSGIGMPATLFDVEQIEVLRGPQGTTYGANALAGLVSVRTREPRPQFELSGEATAGEYGTHGAGGVLGGPLGGGETAAFRVVAQRYRSDGFRRNVFLGRDDTNGYDETTLRAKLGWAPREDLEVELTALHVDLDNGYDAFAIDNSRVTRSDDPGRDAQRSSGLALRLEYSGFERFVLMSTTTAADSDIVYSFDGDWGNDADWGIYAPYDFTAATWRERRTWSQDLRLVSAPGGEIGGRAAWVLGLYVLDARETNDELQTFNGEIFDPPPLSSRYTATNYALYGETDIAVAPRLTLSVGARLEHREAEYEDNRGSAFDPGETMVGGHVSLEYRPADRRSLYATFARGYKAGGFNIGQSVPEPRRTFDAEYLWNLEAGVKARSADGRFDVDAALFYMRRTDQQVNTSFQVTPGDPLSFVFFTDNAARGENYGLEASLAWRATDRLELAGTVGLLETRYIGYRYGTGEQERDLHGREQAHAPQYQLGFAAQYRHPLGFVARLDVQSVDDFYYDASHDERSEAFTLVHLKLGYETERWSAYAWARNLFDEDYAMRGFFFGNEPPDFAPKRYVQPGDPRQLGVTIRYTFR